MQTIRFVAHGLAAPKGSKNQFGGESSKRVKPWMGDVARAAGEAMEGVELFRGPVRMHITFVFPRRKLDFKANGELKDNAPIFVTTRPDLDKLVRAVADALTGIVYADDNQIAALDVEKRYGSRAQASVIIQSL